MEDCKHIWVFQETYKKFKISGDRTQIAHFTRVDRYYCSNCCEIKELEKKESVDLPFDGIRNIKNFEPIWY
ncbi:hypothetical protein [Clostridium estertheticum]|uniref:hypothetical protein n=1 Tax=Clostridium estertheticum TaxID=238834 RepID=UPI001C0CE6C1|nr:hypothetical protein [Clostridium estertheticum]MBU3173347.1 hypothetical protein [Clostridium estertheticum]